MMLNREKNKTDRIKASVIFLDIQTDRLTASHRSKRLMLLDSSPDMVHGVLSHSTCPTVYPKI